MSWPMKTLDGIIRLKDSMFSDILSVSLGDAQSVVGVAVVVVVTRWCYSPPSLGEPAAKGRRQEIC